MRFSDQVNSKANEDCTLFRCSVCKQEKPREQFFKNKSKACGISAACKPCHLEQRRIYVREGRKFDENFRPKYRHKEDYYNRLNKEKNLKRKYGLTVLEFDKMRMIQQFKCAICSKHETELGEILHVDHDHNTGKVRGLLCLNCNHGIGMLKDNLINMQNAVKYLTKSIEAI